MTTLPEAHPVQARRWSVAAIRASLAGTSRLRYTLYVYLASRLLYLLLAVVEMLVIGAFGSHTGLNSLSASTVAHPTLGSELSNWDGKWYLLTAAHGYDHRVYHHAGDYQTLGFMPLYPMLMWALAQVTQIGNLGAGLALSLIFGAIATVLIAQLAEAWWGPERARRAILLWCFFPGTVVFSMVYTESLTLTLIASCLILLRRRRWAWAGLCAGAATAVAPVALSAIPVCAVAAGLELRERGWRDPEARRALLAPLLSPLGAACFAIFLWFWTGSPLADYTAQHVEWSESSTPFAVPHVFFSIIQQLFISGGTHGPAGIDLNGILALAGTAFLFWGLKLMWDNRARIPVTAWVWTLCVALLALTSSRTPPNPRMLVVTFPVVLAVGAALSGRGYRRALGWMITTTVVITPITYVGLWLRP